MGKTKPAGQNGDETVTAIKAALMATPDEGASAPIVFPDIKTHGEDAFTAVTEFVESLIETQQPLHKSTTWKEAGLRGHGHMIQIASRHAMEAARAAYDRAVSKSGFTATPETLDQHPALDFEAAMGWLFKTNVRLFADRSYAHLGGSSEAFYNAIQKSYADLACQSANVAASMLDADEDDPRALGIIERIWSVCFDRLGIQTLDDHLADALGFTAGDLDTLEYRATRGKLRTSLREASKLRWSDRNGRSYGEALIDAWATMQNDESVLEDVSTFTGTNFTPESFEHEFERMLDVLITKDLQALENHEMDVSELYALIENLERWRDMFGEVEEPEDIDPDHAGEDFWRFDVLRKFGYGSYSHMMECLNSSYASLQANMVLNTCTQNNPDDVYDSLMEVRDCLQKGNIAFDRPGAFAAIMLDRDAYFAALTETAPAAIDRDFNYAYQPALKTEQRLQLLLNADDAFDRIDGTLAMAWTSASPRSLATQLEKMRMRRAEEILAMSRIAYTGEGLYLVMKPALDLLDDLGLTLMSDEFHSRTGMDEKRAASLARLFDDADISTLWKTAISDEEDPLQRLVYAMEFENRFAKLDSARQVELQYHLDGTEQQHRTHLSQIADKAMNTAVERMGLAPHDTLKNAEFLSVIRNGLSLINPNALDHPLLFRRLTGKDLSEFLSVEQDTKSRVDQLVGADRNPFVITKEQAAARLVEIAHMKRSAQGWYALRDLRHDAIITGFSLADNDILNAARANYSNLADLNAEHALAGAQECLDAALAKGPGMVSLNNLSAHQYHDFVMARRWLGRSGFALLKDDAYEAMGLAGRADFVERMRESLFDYTMQIESAIFREGIAIIGPFQYLKAMREIRDAYQRLGFDNERDDGAELPPDMTSNAVSVTTVREALSSFAPRAHLAILNSDRPLSVKHRQMREIMQFSARMGIGFSDNDTTKAINQKFTDTVYGRMKHVLDVFAKKPDDMARGWRVACAIGQVRDEYDLERLSWFDQMFEPLGYRTFRDFCEDMAVKRLDQLHRRCQRRIATAGVDQVTSGAFHRDIIADIARMRSVIESPFLDDAYVNLIMNNAQVSREWMNATERLSASLALPMMADIVFDPTMQPENRAMHIDDVFTLRNLVGPEDRIVKRMDWDELDAVRSEMLLMRASHHMLRDMLRGDKPSWSPRMLQVYALFEQNGMALSDTAHLQKLGLSEGEATQYASLDRLAFAYTMLLQLDKVDPKQVGNTHNIVVGMFRDADRNGIDFKDRDIQRMLGLRSDNEMHQLIIAPALFVARSFSNTLKDMQDPVQGRTIGKAMQNFMKATRLEAHVDQGVLKEFGIFDRASLGRLIGNFGQMLKTNRRKNDGLQPA